MGKIKFWVGAALAVSCTFTNVAVATPLTDGNNAFALDLYGQLKATDGNLFFSPYSISTCLGMVYAGARSDTATQMAATLHYPATPTKLPGLFKILVGQFDLGNTTNGIQLAIANGLWGQTNHPFTADFLTLAKDDFAANLNHVDFRTQAEPARQEINNWVSQQTHDKINDLIPSGAIDSATRLVLVNAIYFKGQWFEPFRKEQTRPAPFFITRTNQISVPLMRQEAHCSYFETDTAQLLELPYRTTQATDPHLSLVVILPRERDGLNQLETSLTSATLSNWLSSVHSEKVNVSLPKFKLTNRFSLASTLAKMGMPLAFSPDADFSGMDGARDLFLSAVVHQAFVDVNEQGTEAAAATGAVMALTSALHPRPPIVFRADHPFIFLIRDTNGSILFLGRVTDPTK